MFTMRGLTRRGLAAGIAIAAVGFPSAAQAMWVGGPYASHARLVIAPPSHVGNAPTASSSNSSSSFDWGDAGIGAGGAIVLLSAGAAASVSIRRRGQRVVTG